jgi:hypothetical protein
LLLAVCVGGFAGYQWHKRTMGEAKQATSAALKKADAASDELQRASTNLDKIIADPSLGAVDKARRITEIVTSLQEQAAGLLATNAQLRRDEKAAVNQARARAQERAVAEGALEKMQGERDTARSDQALADMARWKAEAERDQARNDQVAAESARVKAERERAKSQQDKAAADEARAKVEAERDQLAQQKNAAEIARQKAEAERDRALQNRSPDVAAPVVPAPAPVTPAPAPLTPPAPTN